MGIFATIFPFLSFAILFEPEPVHHRQAYRAMEPGAFIEFQNIHFPWRSENPSLHESDLEQHSYNLITGARGLEIDLRTDENFESRLSEAGSINHKEETFA